jgi:CheY-like chemotaxis protein
MPVSLTLILLLIILGTFSQLLLLLLRQRPLLQPLFPLRLHLEPPGAALPSRPPVAPAADRTGRTILLVDDEAGVRELLQTVLTAQGYRVLTAANGEEGLRLFAAHAAEVALVISDIHMPQGEGEAFVGEIRRLRAEVPVLYISGLGGEEEPGTAPRRSSDPFLMKPFKPAALLETVNQLVQAVPRP